MGVESFMEGKEKLTFEITVKLGAKAQIHWPQELMKRNMSRDMRRV